VGANETKGASGTRPLSVGGSELKIDDVYEDVLLKHILPQKWDDLEDERRTILESIVSMVKRSEDLEDPQKVKLLELALEFESIWSLQLKNVGPAKVTPLVVRPKRDAKPKRCKSRKYPPEAADCVYRNPNAIWSSPVYVVRKSLTVLKAIGNFL
jgi:hypothetical protein